MSEQEDRKMVVIKGGNLLDGSGAKPRKNCLVVVEGTKVTAVGEEVGVEIQGKSEVTEIDASGKTIMPGLIDSHLHLIGMKTDRYLEEQLVRPPQLGLIKSVSDAADLLAAGFTTVKDCGGFGIHLKRAIGEGTIRGPFCLQATLPRAAKGCGKRLRRPAPFRSDFGSLKGDSLSTW